MNMVLTCIGIPILDHNILLIAVTRISGTSHRFDDIKIKNDTKILKTNPSVDSI